MRHPATDTSRTRAMTIGRTIATTGTSVGLDVLGVEDELESGVSVPSPLVEKGLPDCASAKPQLRLI